MKTNITLNGRTYKITGVVDMSRYPKTAKSTSAIFYIEGKRGAVGSLNVAVNGCCWIQWISATGSRVEGVEIPPAELLSPALA